MYITITDIVGEKRIDLACLTGGKEVAVISMFSGNILYEVTKSWTIDLGLRNKQVAAGTYARRELIDLVEGTIELTQFDQDPRIKRMNKLEDITEMVFNLDELDNTNNLENGSPSNPLLIYHVTSYHDFTHFGLYALQYKKLKNGEFVSLTLRIKHMKNNIMTDSLATTVVLHKRE